MEHTISSDLRCNETCMRQGSLLPTAQNMSYSKTMQVHAAIRNNPTYKYGVSYPTYSVIQHGLGPEVVG